jgi:quinol monooxygenase YgiN
MITIVAKFKVKPECIEKFKRSALNCVRNTRKECGNITYKIFQGRHTPDEFTFIEEWLNDVAIDKHNNMPHFKAFLDEIKPLCEADPIIEQIMAVPSVY